MHTVKAIPPLPRPALWIRSYGRVSVMPSNPEPLSPKAKAFHAHLDVCVRCENAPFDLCATGARLIREAALESAAALGIADAAKRCFDAAEGP